MTQTTEPRWCPACGQYKSPTAFYSGRAGRRCRDCCRAQMRKRNDVQRQHVRRIKLERGCVDCGYREHAEALEFDHLPGYVKVDSVAHLLRAGASIEVIDAEIAKCELVCANCHRARTMSRPSNTRDWDLRRDNITSTSSIEVPNQLALEIAPPAA